MNMKKIIYLMIAGFVINSCNNLDLVPLDKLPANAYYKTAADFDGAIFAAYSSIQDFGEPVQKRWVNLVSIGKLR
mgnify:CR=1 FL=1